MLMTVMMQHIFTKDNIDALKYNRHLKEGRKEGKLGLCALKLAQPIRLIQCDYLNILWLFFGYSSGHIIHT